MAAPARTKAYQYGINAEKIAGWYLRCKGYRVVATRYRNSQGEIDLVALKRNLLVAVEVKARRNLASCEESVTPIKQQRVARTMEGLLGGQGNIPGLAGGPERDIRFDVIWVMPWRLPVHIKDAWRM